MARVVVDPVTRIEGHLRIEAEVDRGAVQDAWSSSTMFRGIEIILQGARSPGCVGVHAAHLRRVHDRPRDRVDSRRGERDRRRAAAERAAAAQSDHRARRRCRITSSTSTTCTRSTGSTSCRRCRPIPRRPRRSPNRSRTGRCRARSTSPACAIALKGFVDRGQLGPFANAYWGHPAYRLPPEANLMAVAHYLEALDWQREFIKMHAVLGGKNPHLQSFLVGGMATPVDPDSQAALNTAHDRRAEAVRREGDATS